MDEFAVDPQRGAGISILHAFDPPLADRRPCDKIIESAAKLLMPPVIGGGRRPRGGLREFISR